MFSVPKVKFLKPDDDSFASERDAQPVDDSITTFVFNAHHSLAIEAQRERLPIRKYRDQILYCLEQYQTLVLVGETGCGKSTQVPQYLYEFGWHSKGVIGVTQPRRVSALTVADRIANERGEILGDTVGVSVSFIDKCSENTQIKFMTEGILLREMLADPLLQKYGIIMIDEAHERSLLTDTVLGLLKKVMKKRDSLKVIISSATIDAEFFKKFFTIKSRPNSAVILSVEGKMYPVECFYMNEPCPDYVKETVSTVLKIHEKEANRVGDILAFLTGQEEVLDAVQLLKEHTQQWTNNNLQVLPMYGTLPNADQLKVFFSAPKGTRKAIIATNIAETSVTIPGVSYVIDCGFVKMKWFDSNSNTDSLVVIPISKAQAEQRAGRAGRLNNGKVFRLYTEEAYEKLVPQIPPEMRRSDLSTTVIYLKALGIDNVLRFDFPSKPPAKNLLAALELLLALEALDSKGSLTQPVGYFLAELPISPMMGRMLYNSIQMACSEEILSIIAMLQVQAVFSKPVTGQGQIQARIKKRDFEVAEGDLITLLNVFTSFVTAGRTKEWCGQHYVIYKNLKRAYELREQLAKLCRNKIGMPLISCHGNVTVLQRCIASGFFPNAAYLHHSGVYRTCRGNRELEIHPLSCLYTIRQPQYIVFCELLHTTKAFMKEVTVIEGDWLTELVPHYYVKKGVRYEDR